MRTLLQDLSRLAISENDFNALAPRLAAVDDWALFLQDAEMKAIAPLLYRHFQQHGYQPPGATMLSLRALALRHSAAADARYQLMGELLPAFQQAEIPLVALKGLALAADIYPSDELRPMRDIDVLVPRRRLAAAGELLRELGFDLPLAQPSKFMRDSHQLPNATKTVNGFTISVEVHHDALSRDVPGHLRYEDVAHNLRNVPWRELTMATLGHEHMLHQVARHLAGLHPGAVLKLVNVLDVVLYAEKYRAEIDWQLIADQYSHVINTLKCLHYITPLSAALQQQIGGVSNKAINGVGETMQAFTLIAAARASPLQKLAMLLSPPDWWLHLYYNVSPEKSLLMTKILYHPMAATGWALKRLWSRVLGG